MREVMPAEESIKPLRRRVVLAAPQDSAGCVLVGWRVVREDRDVPAGIVLSVVVLKPQAAALVPFALLAARRYRAFAAWVATAAALAGTSLLTLGPHGLAEYITSLSGLPASSLDVTPAGVLGLTGAAVAFSGAIIVSAAVVTTYQVRSAPGLAIAAGVLASLLATPYLYENDLCLLGAAGWILWQGRPTRLWRALLIAVWLLAATHLALTDLGAVTLKQWPLVELALFLALVTTAWFDHLDRRPAAAPTS